MMLNPQRTPTTMELLLLPLVCVCLLSCCGKTSADETGRDVIKMVVKEGTDVILSCSFPTSVQRELFDWKKDGQTEVFMYDNGNHYNNGRGGQDQQFKGRVFHFPEHLESGNASIVIRSTKVTDSGNYTCDFPRHQPKRRSHISLVVEQILKERPEVDGASPKPYTKILSDTTAGVLLKCEVQDAFPEPKLEWRDSDGTILPAEKPQVFKDEQGRYSVTLLATVTRTATNRFRCVVKQEDIGHVIEDEITVWSPVPGAASKPSITTLDQTKDWSLLQCEVQGASPKPKVEWQDSAGKMLPAEEPQVTERGGSYDITLDLTVTKTDRYRCVATQEEIGHQTGREIYVHINDQTSTSVIIGVAVAVALLCLIVGVAVGRSGHCSNQGSSQQNRSYTVGKESETSDS